MSNGEMQAKIGGDRSNRRNQAIATLILCTSPHLLISNCKSHNTNNSLANRQSGRKINPKRFPDESFVRSVP